MGVFMGAQVGEFTGVQVIVTALLSSGLVGGFITMFTKKVWSPESKNELARIGNEFAQLLLEEARSEREELRATIDELKSLLSTRAEAIKRLEKLANEKDSVIQEMEERQKLIAIRIHKGQKITLHDLFGPYIPKEFQNKLIIDPD